LAQARILRLGDRNAQGHPVLVEMDDDHLQAVAGDLLGFDADHLADPVGRIDHEIALPERVFLGHSCSHARSICAPVPKPRRKVPLHRPTTIPESPRYLAGPSPMLIMAET